MENQDITELVSLSFIIVLDHIRFMLYLLYTANTYQKGEL